MVLVGFSNVGIEALAFDCKVFIPIFSDGMFMSPLGGFDRFYKKIYNPQELRCNVKMSLQNAEKKEKVSEAKDFVSNYWCLDRSLKRWEKLLA